VSPKKLKNVPYKSHSQLESDISGFYGLLGMALLPFNANDGMIIMTNAEKLAISVMGVAKRNKRFRDTLVRLTTITVYGALIASHASVAIAILQNHEIIPSINFTDKSTPIDYDPYANLADAINDTPIDIQDYARRKQQITVPEIS